MFKKLRQKIRDAQQEKQWIERTKVLSTAMDKLVRDHSWFAKIDDSYFYIGMYVQCNNMKEYEFCKEYLKNRYSSGFLRYDNERL